MQLQHGTGQTVYLLNKLCTWDGSQREEIQHSGMPKVKIMQLSDVCQMLNFLHP